MSDKKTFKPELLIPVGSPDSFYAALEAKADAIYLGSKSFNARGRAKNFTINQLHSLIELAHKQNTKVYLTLNTLIKNQEIKELIDLVFTLSQLNLDSIIIQDLGVLYILKKYFPKLVVHASTQMAIHNHLGANFAQKNGLERVILSRELTLKEVTEIKNKSNIELEVFVHGALCYSFSGFCLFSSYVGGHSANRGMCRQPCRRIYKTDSGKKYLFNLKDFELIDYIPKFAKLHISSLKIEGRMKSPDYVYQVTRAYRLAIDDNQNITDAKEILRYDFGREKTKYFMGGNISKSISTVPYTGVEIGKILEKLSDGFVFKTNIALHIRDRIRILSQNGFDSKTIKLNELFKRENNDYISVDFVEKDALVKIKTNQNVKLNDKVLLVGLGELKFKSKIPESPLKIRQNKNLSLKILKEIKSVRYKKEELFLRINDTNWLRKIFLDKIDFLILKLNRRDLSNFKLTPFLKRYQHKLIVELPRFMPEEWINFYQDNITRLQKNGIKNFMVGHISQVALFSSKTRIFSSEYVYALNDFAIKIIKEIGIKDFVYPLESDIENLASLQNKSGIVPLYFFPELFYSRMPIDAKVGHKIADDKFSYIHTKFDGMTIIHPEKPVSVFQFKKKFEKYGFNRFLIDLSYEKPNKNRFNKLMKAYQNDAIIQPSGHFNFKFGLK